jgi:cytochrome c oxidase subunit II
MSSNQHLTTRRGFIAALGFGGVSLYGLWAAYGAAPTPLALFSRENGAEEAGGHGGHGAAQHGPDADEFRAQVADFVERYSMPDGSVYPRQQEPVGDGHDPHAAAAMEHGGHATAPAMQHGDHDAVASGHGAHGAGAAVDAHDAVMESLHAEGDGPIDVYLIAEKWFYEPAHLRLDAGVEYRFRMMAADVSHGASIQFGSGGRMIRLRPNRVTEMVATFEKPGSFLVYCTVYCGAAHDAMQARIEVV